MDVSGVRRTARWAAGIGGACLLGAGTAAPAFASTPRDAAPAVCPTPTSASQALFTATDPTPAAVTTAGGSTVVSITFTSGTDYNYLAPVFSIQVPNGNDGIDPLYAPTYEYSVDGSAWTSIPAVYEASGLLGGGDTWAAYLPQWTNVPDGAVHSLKMKVTFGGSIPSGTYNNWFTILTSEICSSQNDSPSPSRLAPLTYDSSAPSAVQTTSAPKIAPAGTGSGSGHSGSGGSASAGLGSGSGSAGESASSAGRATDSTAASATHSAHISASASLPAESTASGRTGGSARAHATQTPVAGAEEAASTSASSETMELGVFGVMAMLIFGVVSAETARRRRFAGDVHGARGAGRAGKASSRPARSHAAGADADSES